MVNLSNYQAAILAASEKNNFAPTEEHGSLFIDHLFLLGYKTENSIKHGELVRIGDPTDKPHKQSGWYVFYQGDFASVGVYGSWKNPELKQVWYSHDENSMTFNQRTLLNEKVKEAQARQQQALKEKQAETAIRAKELYESLPSASIDNEYLARKKVGVYGIKEKSGKLHIPVTFGGNITSMQIISPDGSKKFMTGGRVKGCYFVIPGNEDITYIAEGYATGASIYEATGNAVYIAFSAHNLYETASIIRGKAIVCGDNDNTCITYTKQIHDALKIDAIFPPSQYNDFNDWWVADKEAMIAFFSKKPKIKEEKENDTTHNFKPSGAIKEIVNYYNATAKKAQPLFAIQAAIAACSVILARNFETNRENRTSLFLMNVAKSGTGKEHAKKIIEKILESTGNEHLISGDGYTSQSAVISACQERPRHITIIDEFSKYLQASQNKNSGGHMAEANATLMQAIGRLEGKIRAKARASIGLSATQKKELQNQTVVCPAITLLTMTTPEDFFNTIGADAIKDGFINRFIICISDSKREMPTDKEPMDVPQSIIDWESKIKARRGASDESPVLQPLVVHIPFAPDCTPIQNQFHQYCIDIANKNETFGLAEISGRSAEMAYRLALIIALSENPDAEAVEARHMEQAIEWVKFNLNRLIKELKSNVSNSKHEAAKKEILKALRFEKNGVSKTDMFKRPPFSKYERKILDDILSELREADLIIDETEQRESAGRRKVIWKAL